FARMMGGDFSITEYFLWNEVPVAQGNLGGGLALTGLARYTTQVRSGDKEDFSDEDDDLCDAIKGIDSIAVGVFKVNKKLKIIIGQYSSAGIKAQNQDYHGVYIPEGHALSSKGIACAIADGISSSNVSHIAAETAVSSFLSDYYSTSDAWSTQTS